MSGIVITMMSLCLVTLAGFVARKLGYITKEFSKRLSALVIDICCPCLIVSSVMGDTLPDKELVLPLIGVSVLSYVIITLMALLLTRMYVRDKEHRGIFSFMIIFGNVSFIGYPVCQAIFGNEAVFYAATLNLPNTIWVFTVGVMLISGNAAGNNKFNWKVLFCPGCVAAYISILIVALGITGIPEWLRSPMTLIGNITVPASLLIIGASIAEMPLRSMLGTREVYITSILRMVLVPVLMFALFTAIPCHPNVRNMNMIVLGMPVASYGTMLCLKYGKNVSLMAETTLITTIMSLFSIPLLTLLF